MRLHYEKFGSGFKVFPVGSDYHFHYCTNSSGDGLYVCDWEVTALLRASQFSVRGSSDESAKRKLRKAIKEFSL